jgi:hypothetical protein
MFRRSAITERAMQAIVQLKDRADQRARFDELIGEAQ